MNTIRSMIGLAALAALPIPTVIAAQVPARIAVLNPVPPVAVTRCGPARGAYAGIWASMLASASLAGEAAKTELRALEDSLSTLVAVGPDDIELQYTMAAVIGARAEIERGLGQIEAAKEAHARARTVLAMDPGHPGAQHILGRLNFEVLRMSRVKRFLATRVLGGGELAAANWGEARRMLEAGAVGDPCSPDHNYHLARLYAEVGDVHLARERLAVILRSTPSSARDSVVTARAVELLAGLEDVIENGSR
jgi:hypothetical protein